MVEVQILSRALRFTAENPSVSIDMHLMGKRKHLEVGVGLEGRQNVKFLFPERFAEHSQVNTRYNS